MKIIKRQDISEGLIVNKIYFIRGQKVMLDYDLGELYQVPTKVLNQAVKRNSKRFPLDFMFKLNEKEAKNLRSQIVTANSASLSKKRYFPLAFTEQGVAMLSSVLNSERAIKVNIQIMRTFTKLRAMLSSHQELKQKLQELEKKYDSQFRIVFEAIQGLIEEDEKPKLRIGFKTD